MRERSPKRLRESVVADPVRREVYNVKKEGELN